VRHSLLTPISSLATLFRIRDALEISAVTLVKRADAARKQKRGG
jgi:hypothetical protein